MSELLLKSIIEKLEAWEIGALRDNNAGKDEAIQAILKEVKSFQPELSKLPSEFKAISEKMREVLRSVGALNLKLENPIKEQIKHNHHLHKGIWISIGLLIISLLFLYGWINCSNTKNAFEANDIKYRYLKANANVGLLKLLYRTDSLYNLNKDLFARQVVEKEQRLAEQAELFRLADEKKKDSISSKHRVQKIN